MKTKRLLKWTALGFAAALLGFLFLPGIIRKGYHFASRTTEIESLRQKYNALESAESSLPETAAFNSRLRRSEIAAWLAVRNVFIDPGIRDEGVEHASFFVRLWGTTLWQWQDLLAHWSRPSAQRTPAYLLSNIPPPPKP